MLQEIAQAAEQSGAQGQDLEHLAALGTRGLHKQNISKAVIDTYCKNPDLKVPMPYIAKVPVLVRTKTGDVVSNEDFYMFLPTDWLEAASEDSVGDCFQAEVSQKVLARSSC